MPAGAEACGSKVALFVMNCSVLQLFFHTEAGLTFAQVAELHTDDQSDLRRSKKLTDFSASAEVREKVEENIAVESTEIMKTDNEQRSEGISPETNPVRNENTEDGLTSQTHTEKQKTEEKTEHELTKTTNIEETLDRNQLHVKGNEESVTPETFPTSIILKEDTKEDFIPDTVEYVDADTEFVVEMRENGLNLVPNSKTETNNKSRIVKTMLTDGTKNWEIVKPVKNQEAEYDESDVKYKKSDRVQEILEEERESRLVAGISFHDTRGDTHEDEKISAAKQEIVAEEKEERAERGEDIKHVNIKELVEGEKEDGVVVYNLTPPLSTSSAQVRKESENPATTQIITQPQNPPPPPPLHHHHHHNAPPPPPLTPTHAPSDSSHPPTLYTTASFLPLSVSISISTSISHISDLTVSPGNISKLKEAEEKAVLEAVMVRNVSLNPAWKELQTHTAEHTREINTVDGAKEEEFISAVQEATPEPKEAKFIGRDIITKQPNPSPKLMPNTTQPTFKPRTVMENDTKLSGKQNKASPSQLTKASAKPQLTTTRTPSMRPTKSNKSGKNKTIKKSKEKKRKKDNKTQKKKAIQPTTPSPYFMNNYCPPECACYGRVVQCSDKGVNTVPYGIPYNARYILLMNNHINSIQLDLFNDYTSMEFLVLSNNQLTDGAIEGAFEGIPALKRLYLDKNLLKSVPNDLPVSLEELRLDNNRVRVLSEAAWARCPSLLVLSLSYNSLGNGSEPLPNAVLSPLCNLRTLNLDHNQLTSVPLGLPLSIKELYLKGNLIEQFRGGAFNGKSGLLVLDLSANRLTNIGLLRDSLLNATHLESLNLEGNRLKQVPRHLPPSLKTLNLQGNLISSIKKATFSSLKNLEHLGLARNKIFKVAPGAFRTLSVLHQLDMSHNTLRQVPRQLPQGLHSVALTHNKIQSVPRDAFCWGNKSLSGLVQVQLEHNLIDLGKLDAQAFRCLRGFQVVHFY
ncbi:uncharacterized protein LOC111578137 [Amphiprion ocellaris]|uniref:uncharacterized protein LOC111578137 n=1 Tax=Amphiprion ocellaris TaxID=80972 RepID=UPI0024112734|nr:uncharacterized protein LOC111578137 [Amphiprion ocellaris]